MKILVVATKSPWPPIDGGRLALWLTLQGLAAAGHQLQLVAPVDQLADAQCPHALAELATLCTPHLVVARRHGWLAAAWRALRDNAALTVARHRLDAVEQVVKHIAQSWQPDVIHVEQLQAFGNAVTAGVPIVLRMQNVESSLWQQVALARWRSRPLVMEAVRLRRDEVRAMRSATRVIALTERDAQDLQKRLDEAPSEADSNKRVCALPPPFPAYMPCAPAVIGAPAICLSGSLGWWPNQQGTQWFIDKVLPHLQEQLATARVHVWGGAAVPESAAIQHPPPSDSMTAFPAGAICAVPLHIASGIRMRILEAWARGLPVVATSTAAAGLNVKSGRELLIADHAQDFASAIGQLARDSALRERLISAGRAYLTRYHDGAACAAALLKEYASSLTDSA